ncbi:MAG TPA: diguanylate cyclase [Actinomycetota bacterium]|nr:diguanylate cyclase [Actinomycetota bacterium]
MAAVLFAVSGLVSAITALLPIQEGVNRPGEFGVGVAAIGVGVWAWLAPWERWPRSRSLWLPPLAFAILASTYVTGSSEDVTFATYFVVVFVWIGICHPRWTSVRMLPLGVGAYVLPLVFTGEGVQALDSTLEVAVLCGIVGEGLAWVSDKLRAAEAVDERRGYEIQMLLRSAELLARENDPARLPKLAVELGVQLLRSDTALLLLLEGQESMRAAASYGWPEEVDEIAIGSRPEPRRLAEGDRIALLGGAAFREAFGLAAPTDRLMLLPLPGASRPQGVLAAGLGDRPLDEFGRDVALTFATQAGLALERVKASQALREETLRDELTGLGNRRYANLALADAMSGDALVVIDLDRFKELNDSAGHAAGDEVLRALAAHLRTALREDDTAARLGSDEFLLILRGVRDNASATLDRLELQWRAADPPVTYSAGIAVRGAGESAEEALARADAALLAAKRRGRDRVSIAAEP